MVGFSSNLGNFCRHALPVNLSLILKSLFQISPFKSENIKYTSFSKLISILTVLILGNSSQSGSQRWRQRNGKDQQLTWGDTWYSRACHNKGSASFPWLAGCWGGAAQPWLFSCSWILSTPLCSAAFSFSSTFQSFSFLHIQKAVWINGSSYWESEEVNST